MDFYLFFCVPPGVCSAHSQWTQALEKSSLADIVLHGCARGGAADGFVLAKALVAARTALAATWAAGALSDDLAEEQAAWRRWHLTRFFAFSVAGDGAR